MEIDTNSTSLATLALPVIDGGYAPGWSEFCHQACGQCSWEESPWRSQELRAANNG